MQKVEETTSMPPHNPIDTIPEETESYKTTDLRELEKPFSSENRIKPEESVHESHEVPNKALAEEEQDTCNTVAITTVPTKSEGIVGESSSGRETLKRHRVEVAGRVWIPDMWGQEDFLKDWIDCTAFDSSLVNSSIMSARASLVEEGRRARSTRLRVENI